MTPAQLSSVVLRTVRRAVEDGELRVPVPGQVVVKRSPRAGCGDYATGVALQLAPPAGLPARSVAEILRPRLAAAPGIELVEIAGHGFLNITLADGSGAALVRDVRGQGGTYGHGDALAGRAIRLTFPHETRAAVVADSLRRILGAQGADVRLSCDREPDSERAAAWAALRITDGAHGPRLPSGSEAGPVSGSAAPESGAPRGSGPVAGHLGAGPRLDSGPDSGPVTVPAAGSLPHGTGLPEQTSERLEHGFEADSVPKSLPATAAARISDCEVVPLPVPVPVAASAAELLRALGPDAARWALLRPAAHDHPRLTDDLLVQRETNPLFRVQYAHARACALVRNAAELGAAPGSGDRSPESGVVPEAPGSELSPPELSEPQLPVPDAPSPEAPAPVRDLLALLREHPAVLAAAARHRAPDRVARHLEQLAAAFFRFHDSCPVLPRGDEKPEAVHRDRAALAEAAGTVLANGLHLLGIHAPRHL
ncbi:MAG TPA: hypothetical protein DEQ61_19570 [Streptomyces sp.]|nr:hypothetical protein [Streptomyces sp.]